MRADSARPAVRYAERWCGKTHDDRSDLAVRACLPSWRARQQRQQGAQYQASQAKPERLRRLHARLCPPREPRGWRHGRDCTRGPYHARLERPKTRTPFRGRQLTSAVRRSPSGTRLRARAQPQTGVPDRTRRGGVSRPSQYTCARFFDRSDHASGAHGRGTRLTRVRHSLSFRSFAFI